MANTGGQDPNTVAKAAAELRAEANALEMAESQRRAEHRRDQLQACLEVLSCGAFFTAFELHFDRLDEYAAAQKAMGWNRHSHEFEHYAINGPLWTLKRQKTPRGELLTVSLGASRKVDAPDILQLTVTHSVPRGLFSQAVLPSVKKDPFTDDRAEAAYKFYRLCPRAELHAFCTNLFQKVSVLYQTSPRPCHHPDPIGVLHSTLERFIDTLPPRATKATKVVYSFE